MYLVFVANSGSSNQSLFQLDRGWSLCTRTTWRIGTPLFVIQTPLCIHVLALLSDCSSAHIAMRAGSNPPEYYLTLSPASRLYRLNGGRPLAMPFWGTDKSIPEFQRGPAEPHDPFRADVYCLGNLIRRDFLEVRSHPRFSRSGRERAHTDAWSSPGVL